MKVLVTGARGGLGRAVCAWAERLEHQVFATSRTLGPGVDVTFDWLDVNPIYTAASIADWIAREAGSIDLCIMAHGLQIPSPIAHLTEVDWCAVLTVNLESCLWLTRELLDRDLMADRSLIVYCSSIQSRAPRASRGPYAIAKAGLEALARVVVQEHAPGIRAVALQLGHLDNVMAGVQYDKQAVERRVPMGLVRCTDVARLVLELHGQSGITGVIDVSGGHADNVW